MKKQYTIKQVFSATVMIMAAATALAVLAGCSRRTISAEEEAKAKVEQNISFETIYRLDSGTSGPLQQWDRLVDYNTGTACYLFYFGNNEPKMSCSQLVVDQSDDSQEEKPTEAK